MAEISNYRQGVIHRALMLRMNAVVQLDEPSHASSLVKYIWVVDRILGDGEVSGL